LRASVLRSTRDRWVGADRAPKRILRTAVLSLISLFVALPTAHAAPTPSGSLGADRWLALADIELSDQTFLQDDPVQRQERLRRMAESLSSVTSTSAPAGTESASTDALAVVCRGSRTWSARYTNDFDVRLPYRHDSGISLGCESAAFDGGCAAGAEIPRDPEPKYEQNPVAYDVLLPFGLGHCDAYADVAGNQYFGEEVTSWQAFGLRSEIPFITFDIDDERCYEAKFAFVCIFDHEHYIPLEQQEALMSFSIFREIVPPSLGLTGLR
jgi:hypothetical protein